MYLVATTTSSNQTRLTLFVLAEFAVTYSISQKALSFSLRLDRQLMFL